MAEHLLPGAPYKYCAKMPRHIQHGLHWWSGSLASVSD